MASSMEDSGLEDTTLGAFLRGFFDECDGDVEQATDRALRELQSDEPLLVQYRERALRYYVRNALVNMRSKRRQTLWAMPTDVPPMHFEPVKLEPPATKPAAYAGGVTPVAPVERAWKPNEALADRITGHAKSVLDHALWGNGKTLHVATIQDVKEGQLIAGQRRLGSASYEIWYGLIVAGKPNDAKVADLYSPADLLALQKKALSMAVRMGALKE